MVLDRYFKAKTRLKAALPALRALRGRAKGAAGASAIECVSTVEQLREVFRVAVFGATGSGKSLLLDVLKEVSEGRLRLDKFSVGQKEAIPVQLLKAIEQSDVVIAVLDAVDPWNSSAWNAIAAVPDVHRHKLLIVLSRSDLRSEAELQPVLNHFKEQINERFSPAQTTRIVSVSARLAQLSGQETVDKENLRQQSGINLLIVALDSTFVTATGCLEPLKLAIDSGRQAIEALRAEMGAVAVEVEETATICKGVEQLGESLLEQTPRHLNSVLTNLDRGIMDVVVSAEDLLKEEPLKGKVSEHAEAIHDLVTGGIGKAIERGLVEAADRMEAHLEKSWTKIGRHLQDLHGEAFRSKDLKAIAWKKRRSEFLKAARNRLEPAQVAGGLRQKVREQLKRRVTAKRCRELLNSLLLGAFFSAIMFQQWVVTGVFAVCLFFPRIAYRQWKKSWRKSSARALWDALDPHREKIESTAATALKQDTTGYAEEFRARVKGLANQAERFRAKKQPVLTDFSEAEAAIDDATALLSGE
ncbi:MAG: hypothetical protein ACI9R3_006521 [Verrucomicrobiales bacterium]|jgi:hypothetical protein